VSTASADPKSEPVPVAPHLNQPARRYGCQHRLLLNPTADLIHHPANAYDRAGCPRTRL
jgi:hypothetical protein